MNRRGQGVSYDTAGGGIAVAPKKRARDRTHLTSIDNADVAADVVQVPLRVQLEVVGNTEPKQSDCGATLVSGDTARKQKQLSKTIEHPA